MIEYVRSDTRKVNILDVEAELLINASNGEGYMGGFIGRFIPLKGVAETIHYVDHTIEKQAKRKFRKTPVPCGGVLHTTAGKLPHSRGILHAVTMEKAGQKSSLEVIRQCLISILDFCERDKVKTVAIPLLGTGTGRVDKDEVIKLYVELLQEAETLFHVVIR